MKIEIVGSSVVKVEARIRPFEDAEAAAEEFWERGSKVQSRFINELGRVFFRNVGLGNAQAVCVADDLDADGRRFVDTLYGFLHDAEEE